MISVRLAHAVSVLGQHHVDARDHDLARDGVPELEDLVNHPLLFFEQGSLLGDEKLDLLFGDGRAPHVGSDTHDSGHCGGRCREEPNDGRQEPGEKRDRSSDGDGDFLGALKPQSLGHEFAEDESHIRNHHRDEQNR